MNISKLERYPKCSDLFSEIYPMDKIENYRTKYKQDPFFKLAKNSSGGLEDLNSWYKQKNPNFIPFSESNNPEMPEFKHLIAGMIKDFYFFLNDTNIKKNNIDKLNIILDKIENILNEENKEKSYKYIFIIDVIYDYLIFFEIIVNKSANKKRHCYLLLKIKNTPYIIYPTFHQLDFIKINLTIGTPFLNFLLTNKEHLIHDILSTPCSEIFHDIDYHYELIMIQFFKDLNKILNKNEEYIFFIRTIPSLHTTSVRSFFFFFFLCLRIIVSQENSEITKSNPKTILEENRIILILMF